MKPLILNKNKKLLLFLDIDGTLIMENQKPNYYHLPQLIRKISKFCLCGLNSNRSFHDIKNIYKYFGLNGPIVLENGVYFKKNLSSKKFLLINNPVKVKRIAKAAIKDFINSHKIDCKFLYGDSVEFIISKRSDKKGIFIVANGFREYTGSIHIYRNGKRDNILAEKLASFLKDYFLQKKLNLNVVQSSAFGNVLFWPVGINKAVALKRLKKFYKDYEFAMIGDDLEDLDVQNEIRYFLL